MEYIIVFLLFFFVLVPMIADDFEAWINSEDISTINSISMDNPCVAQIDVTSLEDPAIKIL